MQMRAKRRSQCEWMFDHFRDVVRSLGKYFSLSSFLRFFAFFCLLFLVRFQYKLCVCARLFSTKLTNRIATHTFSFGKTEACRFKWKCFGWMNFGESNRALTYIHMQTHTHHQHQHMNKRTPKRTYSTVFNIKFSLYLHCLCTLHKQVDKTIHLYRRFHFSGAVFFSSHSFLPSFLFSFS